MAIHEIKHLETTGTAPEASASIPSHCPQGTGREFACEEPEFENFLRNLNALLQEHLSEWIAMPPSERVAAALEALQKL